MDRCRICGLGPDEHHDYIPVVMPEGCVCDAGTWDADVTPICNKYEGDGKQYCRTCEHEQACHTEDRPAL